MRAFGFARWLMESSVTSPNHVRPMNCWHASHQLWTAPGQVSIIDGSSYPILKRSNLQVRRVIDLTHGHGHCDYHIIVKVMGAGEASNSKVSDRMACSAAHPEPNEKDRSKAKAM